VEDNCSRNSAKVRGFSLAASLGVSVSEAREKQKLMQLIVKIRKEKKLSQAALVKKVGVSQGRIAQTESGIGTAKVSFDVLLNLLLALGCDFEIVARRAAAKACPFPVRRAADFLGTTLLRHKTDD